MHTIYGDLQFSALDKRRSPLELIEHMPHSHHNAGVMCATEKCNIPHCTGWHPMTPQHTFMKYHIVGGDRLIKPSSVMRCNATASTALACMVKIMHLTVQASVYICTEKYWTFYVSSAADHFTFHFPRRHLLWYV